MDMDRAPSFVRKEKYPLKIKTTNAHKFIVACSVHDSAANKWKKLEKK